VTKLKSSSLRLSLLISVATIIIVIALTSNIAHAEKVFKYVFEVDGEGDTKVMVYFWDDKNGSSWLYVPKDQRWMLNITVYEGKLLNVTYRTVINNGREDPFYTVMELCYETLTTFNASVEYRMKYGALIIEPKATFISPRIVHEGATTNIIAYLPKYAITSEDDVSSISGHISDVEVVRGDGAVVVSAVVGSNDRLVIEYTVPREIEIVNITLGPMVFKTPQRYLEFACRVLSALNEAYVVYKDVFGCETRSICVEFFVPTRKDLDLGIEGYVPLLGRELGPIHLNLLYIRGIEGFMNIVAMHELAHHFLWYVGVPLSKLWVHEGVAECLSLAIGREMGYRDAVEMHESSLIADLKKLSDRLGFIQKWAPSSVPPQELGPYYAASYQVFKTLCERYGGLSYLKRLFEVFKRLNYFDWHDEYRVIKAFGEAAGNVDEVVELFRKWGFELKGLSRLALSTAQIRERTSELSSWLEPYKRMAEVATYVAEALQQHDLVCAAALAVKVSQLICDVSFLLMIASATIIAIALALLRRLT
jgi:hypothetical protein